jgi:selenocysteine-specific elongation factor
VYVFATAGHVDHGKSTLVRALTGMEPDRWAEERRRGMTIDLGFAWTTLATGATVAFVDVPGHERFVPNMLAGVGPVPAALVVVAADEGWKPQSAEHLAALDALGVRHGLLVLTRSDLAAPEAAAAAARAELAATSLGDVEWVAVSATTGAGLDDLRAALGRLADRLPAADLTAPVRLWVDRSFTVRGAGTVVTGTLGAGTLASGDHLVLAGADREVRVRGLQALGAAAPRVDAVARVAVNLRGTDRTEVRRGDALVTPGRFEVTTVLDVRLVGDPVATLAPSLTLHLGSAAVPARIRPLGTDTARLTLARPLPLRIGDRGLLRDPGAHHVAGGVVVLDPAPPALRRRGAAAARATVLSTMDGVPDGAAELARRGLIQRAALERMGVAVTVAPVAGDWLADPAYWTLLRGRLGVAVGRYLATHPLEAGAPVEALRRALGLPDRALVETLAQTNPQDRHDFGDVVAYGPRDGHDFGEVVPIKGRLVVRAGRVGPPGRDLDLPPAVAAAVARIRADLAAHPYRAPEAARLVEFGLGPRELAAAVRAGALLRVADGIVLLPDALDAAARVLADLPQPFTLSAARQALDTTRRVAVPLLELLDRQGRTVRQADDRRTVAAPHSNGGVLHG